MILDGTKESFNVYEQLVGKRVRVYRNLHKNCMSVQTYTPGKGWRVFAHLIGLNLKDVEFKVNETGRQRVLREKKKNVHAYVVGTVSWEYVNRFGQKDVNYNPYKAPTFTTKEGDPVLKAKRAMVRIGLPIVAHGIE